MESVSVVLSVENHPTDMQPKGARRRDWYEVTSNGVMTFGRAESCNVVLAPAGVPVVPDTSISGVLGELVVRRGPDDGPGPDAELWNHSTTNWLIVTGERGYTMYLAPQSRGVLTQGTMLVWVEGALANYGLTVDLPRAQPDTRALMVPEPNSEIRERRNLTLLAKGASSLRNSFTPHYMVIFESMFRDYLTSRPGVFARPRTVAEVYEDVRENPIIKAKYAHKKFGPDQIDYVIKEAVKDAKTFHVPGLTPGGDREWPDPTRQSEWVKHRLAMFLLGSGVLHTDIEP